MKKWLPALLAAALLLSLAVCGCSHKYDETILTPGGYLKEGAKHLVCTQCGQERDEVIPAVTTIKILAIGNSFSVDAMEHLWNVLTNAGFTQVLLGNLYIGGCSLDTHWNNIENDAAAYTYYYNQDGTWREQPNASVIPTLKAEDWDVITIQQASADSGNPDTYTHLQSILNTIQENNSHAKVYWHMTWAYQGDSDHGGFAYYENDQLKMYEAITATVQEKVAGLEAIDGIIPSGTAIQNLRTSEVGDTLTRDGYHLSLGIGRYTAALTWFSYITGLPAELVEYVPNQGQLEIKIYQDTIRQAVEEAIKSPFTVTTVE